MADIVRTAANVFFAFVLLEVFIFVLHGPGVLLLALGRTNPHFRKKVDSVGGIKRFWIEGLAVKSVLVLCLITYIYSKQTWFNRAFLWMGLRNDFMYAFPLAYVFEPILFAFRSNVIAKTGSYALYLYFSIIVSSFIHFASQQ